MRILTNVQVPAVLLLISVACVGQQTTRNQPPQSGAIKGIVLGADERPVANAIVTVQPEDTNLIGKTPGARSGPDGTFMIKGVPPGKNFVFAGNLKQGYPETEFAVFTPKNALLTAVVVEAGKTSTLTLHMPPKGGRLVGKIIDDETGNPVLTARIHLFQAADPERDISTSPTLGAEFNFVLPPIGYKMEVNAPHYKPWKFAAQSETVSGDVLKVMPGETEEVVVRLKRQ